jgi:hypothetical protein
MAVASLCCTKKGYYIEVWHVGQCSAPERIAASRGSGEKQRGGPPREAAPFGRRCTRYTATGALWKVEVTNSNV